MRFNVGEKVVATKDSGYIARYFAKGDAGVVTRRAGNDTAWVQFDNDPPRVQDGLWCVADRYLAAANSTIPGWHILQEDGKPGLWFRTRDEARDVARDAGIPSKQVQKEECGVEA